MATSVTVDLNLLALFVNFTVGDIVNVTYNGAFCQGQLTQLVFDGNNDRKFLLRVQYCANWYALNGIDEITVAQSALTFVQNGQIDDF